MGLLALVYTVAHSKADILMLIYALDYTDAHSKADILIGFKL